MSYIAKNTWVIDEQGKLLQGIKNNGILICHAGMEIDGELAIEIERLENQTKKIPQMDKAETKAVNSDIQNVKIEITDEKPKIGKKKNVNSKRS